MSGTHLGKWAILGLFNQMFKILVFCIVLDGYWAKMSFYFQQKNGKKEEGMGGV